MHCQKLSKVLSFIIDIEHIQIVIHCHPKCPFYCVHLKDMMIAMLQKVLNGKESEERMSPLQFGHLTGKINIIIGIFDNVNSKNNNESV